jgi:hypothetical protein
MQYERLTERSRLPPEHMLFEHMQVVADMDFLVTAVRRLLRTAALARRIPSEHQPQLKLALKVFGSKWGNLTAVRDALEHSDTTILFPLPVVGTTQHGQGAAEFTFAWPGGNLDIGKMYEDARSILNAIVGVIEPIEAERDTAAPLKVP